MEITQMFLILTCPSQSFEKFLLSFCLAEETAQMSNNGETKENASLLNKSKS